MKPAAPDAIAEALALREAGYTALAISQRLGISVRTLQRHFAAHGVRKGAIKKELLDQARLDIRSRVTSSDTIKDEAARLIADDLAHARHLRDVLLSASDHMKASSLSESVLVMRAAAAYSTALKNTSDMVRHTLRLDRLDPTAPEELPALIVQELTAAQVEKVRESQRDTGEPRTDLDLAAVD